MDTYLKEIASLSKYPNDSKIQQKQITLLKEILEIIKKHEKKKITEIQTAIEDTLYNIIVQSRANSDIVTRYIYYILKHLFDFGLSSHLNDFITKYSTLLNSKTSSNIKCTALWLMGKVCSKTEYKTPTMTELIKTLVKHIKSTNDLAIKTEAFWVISSLFNLKLPFFHIQAQDILKLIFKQEKYFTHKKILLKVLNSTLFYLNQLTIEKNYELIIALITKGFEESNEAIRQLAYSTYISMHNEKIFDGTIIKQKIIRKREGEPLKNFLEVLLFIGTMFTNPSDISVEIKMAYLEILRRLFIMNKEYLNSSESLVTKVYDLLLNDFALAYECSDGINKVNIKAKNQNDNTEVRCKSIIQLNKSIEKLYRSYIKVIYNSVYKTNLLIHIFKRLEDSQFDMDKIENSILSITSTKSSQFSSSGNKSKGQMREKKYTEFQVNAMIISLVEFSENNSDLFELNYKTFQDLSTNISVYVTSSIRSFRMLISKVLANLAYFLPSWRISILTLVLNLSSVAHAEVASLKNTIIYFIEGNSAEYKYSLIIKKNIELLKDICNCLGLILTMFAHKSHGLPVDTSLNALTRAKNIILGNLINEDDNPKYASMSSIAKNYSSSDLHAYKESGWIIIQGLCSMDHTWLSSNSKTFFFLWNYIFSASSCEINENDLNGLEYKDALATEFFIKKAALASLRKFILSCQENVVKNSVFASNIQKIIFNALRFFIPSEKSKVIYFYKHYFNNDYQEAKMFIYDCLYSIPTSLYSNKFDTLLTPLSDEIISTQYTDNNYEHIYNSLNQLDNFMCNQNLDIDKYEKEPELIVDNFVVDKFNFKLTNLISKSFQFVFSAIKLLVEIVLSNGLEVKYRKLLFKNLLSNITEVAMKTKTDIGNYNKFVNIAITVYLIIKHSCLRCMYIINDEGIFTNSKMIFDFCFKIEDNNLLRLIAAEGHSYLIKASQNPKSNLEYYLIANECKFKNDKNLSHNDLINTFYLISNIFRNVSFKELSVYLDNYMNFIISSFNRIEDILSNPFVPQSIYIIMNVLISNDQIDHARKLIEIFKMNFLFINRDNSQFFKNLFELNSLTEIRLMLLLAQLNENIKANEFELLKLILFKYTKDEKYKSIKIQKNFLLFAKIILNSNQKFKELIFNESFIAYLFQEKNGIYEQKLSWEILIILMSGDHKFDQLALKSHIERLVNYINNLYHNNNNFYFNNEIFKRNFRHLHSDTMIFDKTYSDVNKQGLASLIDFDNFSHHNFDVLYKNFHLIKLGKTIIRLFFEKNYLNVVLLLNIIKELVLNQLILYSSSSSKSKESKSDSLMGEEGAGNKNQTLITIRGLNYSMHLGLKKFIIKTIQTCLSKALEKILLANKASLIEVLNYFMGSSMVLVTCEESWEIKILGIELLSEIIKKFSTVIDTRTEDNSLLIQQYEAQISSCLKIIFTNAISIKSVYKGLKLLYMFITVPISTDSNYIKKVSHLVDINNLTKNEFSITSGGANSTSFSEKADHLLICKKLIFFCKLYLSLKHQKNITINAYDTIHSQVSQVDIYSQYITPPYRSSINDFFNINFTSFFNSIIKMLHDFYIVLTFDYHSCLAYKEYNYIFQGNKITYSEHKIIKYGQIYLKVLSMLINDKISMEQNHIEIKSIKEIVQLIIFYLNYYIFKCGSNNLLNTDDIADNIKVSFSLNCIQMIQLLDSLAKILNNESNSFELKKEEILNIIFLCLHLLNFSIDELNYTVLILLDSLMRNNLMKCKDNMTPNEKATLMSNMSKILFYYKHHTSIVKTDNNTFIALNVQMIEFIIINYNEIKNINTETLEFFYHNVSFLLDCFITYSIQISKVCAGKLFSSMLLIKDKEILQVYFTTINDALPLLTKQFDKFSILFYLTIQFLSKTVIEELYTETYDYILQSMIQSRLINKEYMFCIIKGLLIGISQSFDVKMKKLIEGFILMVLENNYLLPLFVDDMQNIILSYVLTIEDIVKRKEVLLLLSLALIDHSEVFDTMKLALVILKLFSKDIEYLTEEIYPLLETELQKEIESLIEMRKKIEKEKEENRKKEEEAKSACEEVKRKQRNSQLQQADPSTSASNDSNQQSKSSVPKIKSLKIKKN